ncbi:MAG: TIGR01777 family oxidoreductase [Myxococcota bacterium]|nr:TIGR01777 family oxidoreductase [Myxococcota bacterium]
MRVLVTGATGMIGQALCDTLNNVHVLTRNTERCRDALGDGPVPFSWSPSEGPPPTEAFDGVTHVVHLAGEPVSGARWTAAKKDRILKSRVLSTRHLVSAMATVRQPPKVLICASAIGFYGDRGEEELRESATAAQDFMGHVCSAWEAEASKAERFGTRVVRLRIGLVLGPTGGALGTMVPLFRMGVGGNLGSGQQWMAWIHRDDVVGMIHWALKDERVQGAVNAVSPTPVRNRRFTKALGTVLKRPTILPVPRFAVSALFGEMSAIVFASQRCVPAVAQQLGYTFRYTQLDDALADCLQNPKPVEVTP